MRKQQEGDGGEGEKELHGAVHTHTHTGILSVHQVGLWEPSQPADRGGRALSNPKLQWGSLWLLVLTQYMAGGSGTSSRGTVGNEMPGQRAWGCAGAV